MGYPLKKLLGGGYATLDGAFEIWRGEDDPSMWCVSATNDAAWKAQGVPEFAPTHDSLAEARAYLALEWPVANAPLPSTQNYRKSLWRHLRLAAKAERDMQAEGRETYTAKMHNRMRDLLVARRLIEPTGRCESRITTDGRLALEFVQRQASSKPNGTFEINGVTFLDAYEWYRMPTSAPPVLIGKSDYAATRTRGSGE